MKTIALFLLFTVFKVNAIGITLEGVTFTPITNGQGCNEENIGVNIQTIEHPSDDNGSNMEDHYAYVLIDANNVVLDYVDGFIAGNSPTFDYNLQLFLSNISTRPVIFKFYDKITTDVTPGSSLAEKHAYANSNYALVYQYAIDPVSIGLTACDPVDYQAFCPDPLIYKSGLETMLCGTNDGPISLFTDPLGDVMICIPPGSIGNIDYCQSSCGNGSGCELTISTIDSENFTQNRLCKNYSFSVPSLDFDDATFGSCTLEVTGTYFSSAYWASDYDTPFVWSYQYPSIEIRSYNSNIDEVACNFNSATYHDFISALAFDFIENYYISHFLNNQELAFCELEQP